MAYIPNKLYVGFRADNEDTLTCFMTPLANDSAFNKRKKTIDDWSSKEMSCTEISNSPRAGFRLVDTSRRWNSNNVVFRVIHPEVGAEFEISAENLSNIMSNTDIIKGEIQDKLLLIREGSKNILVIENSPEHLGSSDVDENGKEIFLKKDEYSIGDRISVKGAGEVVYLGKNKIRYLELTSGSYHQTLIRLNEDFEDGYVLFFEKTKKVEILKSVPKVLKNKGTSSIVINDVIGCKFGYRGVIYDIGDAKERSEYNYNIVPMTEAYGYALIKNGSNYDAVYKSGNRHSIYGTVVVREDGVIVPINNLTTGNNYQNSNNTTYYTIMKELK